MNRPAEPRVQPDGCDCDNCRGGELPANPFLAPRITHGMLLGEDDFRTMIGYPRGKHLLHQAWLHGSGVVWGYDVRAPGLYDLEVGRGLAVDPLGRELLHTRCQPLDLNDYVTSWVKAGKMPAAGGECTRTTVHACVVAEFSGCLADPVPTTADPCDVTRTHDDYSRVVERTRIDVRFGRCPDRLGGLYPRVRMLLGVARLDGTDAAGDVRAARQAVLTASDRALELERQLWEMACRDGIERQPREHDAEDAWLPGPAEDAVVVLAELTFTLKSTDDCWSFASPPQVVTCVRTTLLPTDVLTALVAGLAPGLIETAAAAQPGPRVKADELSFEEGRQKLILPVTADLVAGTVLGNVEVTTLEQNRNDHWVVEDIYDTAYEEKRQAIVVRLAYSLDKRPPSALVRIRVVGTGGKPVMGREPMLPLAGVDGRASGDPQDGHDAVWTFPNDRGRSSGAESPPAPGETTKEEPA